MPHLLAIFRQSATFGLGFHAILFSLHVCFPHLLAQPRQHIRIPLQSCRPLLGFDSLLPLGFKAGGKLSNLFQ
jgi:hypothetical protein